jgi:transcription factor SPN1
LDQFADAEVSQLREEMLNAAELDEQANREKLPATLKLKLLSKVMSALRKCVLFPQILWRYSIFDCITRSQELSLAVHCR